MFFALLDYMKYRRRKGIYRDENIRKLGGRLAVPENFSEVASYNPSYLFFCHTRYSIVSWLIMYYTSSVWSHVGSFSEKGRIIDATTKGYIEHPFSDYFDGRSFIAILALKEGIASEEYLAEVLRWGRSHLGLGFNWLAVFRFLWVIVSGAHAHYRIRFSVDFLIVALILSPLSLWSPVIGILVGCVSAIYVLTVVANTPRRRAMQKALATGADLQKPNN